MYISIDMDRLIVVHKHVQGRVVCDLVWIELQNSCVKILPLNEFDFLAKMTDLEIYNLLKSFNPFAINGNRLKMKADLMKYIEDKPQTDVEPFEANVQALQVASGEIWKYVKGSNRPQKISGSVI